MLRMSSTSLCLVFLPLDILREIVSRCAGITTIWEIDVVPLPLELIVLQFVTRIMRQAVNSHTYLHWKYLQNFRCLPLFWRMRSVQSALRSGSVPLAEWIRRVLRVPLAYQWVEGAAEGTMNFPLAPQNLTRSGGCLPLLSWLAQHHCTIERQVSPQSFVRSGKRAVLRWAAKHVPDEIIMEALNAAIEMKQFKLVKYLHKKRAPRKWSANEVAWIAARGEPKTMRFAMREGTRSAFGVEREPKRLSVRAHITSRRSIRRAQDTH